MSAVLSPSPPEGRSAAASLAVRAARTLARTVQTLKFRLMLLVTGLLLAVVGLPVALFVHHLDRNYEEFSTTMLEVTTGFVYQHLTDGLMANDSLGIQQGMELLARDPRIRLLRIYGPTGTILYSSRPDEVRRNVYQLPGYERAHYAGAGHDAPSFTKAGNTYSHRHPILVEPQCVSCHAGEGTPLGTLDVVASFTDSQQLYTYAKQLSVTGGVLIIAILWLATNLLYEGQIEARLHRIIRGFDALARGRYDAKVEMPGRHELAVLADRFNRTVETLEAARRREEQFYQERLERADRLVTLGEIAAEIAHEVNNPTGIIRARAELLRDDLEAADPGSESARELDTIVQQTERIADITKSILHYARKHPQRFAAVDLREVVRRSAALMQPRAKKCRVELVLDLPAAPAVVRGSLTQLEQVFCNLLNNSLDAMQDRGGRVEVAVAPDPEAPGRWRVRYQDDGPGVPPPFRHEVFSPFFTTKQDGKGTGLGLFIARNIVAGHAGRLTLDAGYDAGARFWIELDEYPDHYPEQDDA